MGTRKVKDAIDLQTKEKIYFRGHAEATFMSDGRSVEDAIQQGSGEKSYKLLLNTTFEEDVEGFSVIEKVPNITSYKEFLILMRFVYSDDHKNREGYIRMGQGNVPEIKLERIAGANYLTNYILRIHMGLGWDKKAYLECHTNSFTNSEYNTEHTGKNVMSLYYDNPDVGIAEEYNRFVNFTFHNFKLYVGEKISIYGR